MPGPEPPPAAPGLASYLPAAYLPASYLPAALRPAAGAPTGAAADAAVAVAAAAALAAAADALLGPVGGAATAAPPGDALVAQLNATAAGRAAVLAQFLRARNGDAARAEEMLRAAVAWRARVGIARFCGDAGRAMVRRREAVFPMRMITDSGKGHRQMVCYGLLRLLDKRVLERDAFMDAVTAWLELVYSDVGYVAEAINVILDFSGWSLRRHTPYKAVTEGLRLLQDYYPDRLGSVFVVRYPPSMRAAYAAIKPLLASGVRTKIHFLPSALLLPDHLPHDCLPVFVGGALPVDYGPDIDLQKEWAVEQEGVAGDTATAASSSPNY